MDITQTLINAGLPCTWAYKNPDGTVDASFSRTLTSAEWNLYLSLTNPAEARKKSALANAALATQLKSVTGDQAVAWIENNVTSLATAKDALKIMVRLLIALRDASLSELPDI